MSYFKPVYKKTLVNETALFQTSGFTWMSGGTACCPAPCSFTAIQNNPSNNRPFSNLFVSFNLPTTTANQTNFNLDWAGTQLTALGTLTSSLTKKDILVLGEVMVGLAPAVGLPNVSA